MKEEINNLIEKEIKKYNMYLYDSFVEKIEGKNKLNIILDSDDIIDLNKIYDVSVIINKKLDLDKDILKDIDEVDIYSKEGDD